MDNPIINNILQDDDDDQVSETVETLSLTDFPITQDLRKPPSSTAAGEDFFEFLTEEKMMSHAEDIIFCGKLVPIKQEVHPKKPSQQNQNQNNNFVGCRRSRSEPRADHKRVTTSPLVRTSRSLDYKKMNRNSSMSSEHAVGISRDGSGKKSSSSRWYVLLFGLVKVPPSDMDIREMKNRQVRRSESFNIGHVRSADDHRKCSSRVLGFLSCKSASDVVTTPVGLHA